VCDVVWKDKKSNAELSDHLGIECVLYMVRRGRLRWFGHVEQRGEDDCTMAYWRIVVEGERFRGKGRKTWRECAGSVESTKTKGGCKTG
jgi:hypothetical protein